MSVFFVPSSQMLPQEFPKREMQAGVAELGTSIERSVFDVSCFLAWYFGKTTSSIGESQGHNEALCQ